MLKTLLSYLLNQRGQLGTYPPIQIGNPGSFTETNEFNPFATSAPGPQYGDLMSRYASLMGGGTNSFQSLIDLQRQTGLEQVKNAQAARGLGSRSGVGVAGAAQFLKGFEPQAAAMQADYFKSLMGDYARSVDMGRTNYQPLNTKTTRVAEPSQQAGAGSGAGAGGGSPFQYLNRSGAPMSGGGGGGGGSASGGGGSGGSAGGGTGSMLPGGSLQNFFAGVGGAGSEGPNFYGPSYDPQGLMGGYFGGGGGGAPINEGTYGAFGTGGYDPSSGPYAQSSGGGAYRETYNPKTRSWSMPGS